MFQKAFVLSLVFTFCIAAAVEALPSHGGRLQESDLPYCDLAGRLEILQDADHLWTIEQVTAAPLSQNFSKPVEGVPHLGITDAAFWVRFQLEAPLKKDWVLYVGWPYMASLDLRDFEEHPKQAVVGLSPGDRTFQAWAFPDETTNTVTVYARFVGQGMLSLPLFLLHESTFQKFLRFKSLGQGMYYGIVLGLAFYNLFLFFSLRDRSYLYYVLYMFALLGYFFCMNGLALELVFPGKRSLDSRVTLFFLALIFIAGAAFTRNFLNLRKISMMMDRIVLLVIAIGCLLAGLSLVASFTLLSSVFSVLGAIVPVLLIFFSLIVWWRGFGPARYYFLAWAFYLLGAFIFALTYSGAIPFTWIGMHSYQIGSALEAVLLSLALADRIRLLQREREQALGGERRAMNLALTDALTGLSNSRFFRGQIGPEMQLAMNLEKPLSLLMIDVDDFKKFNDRFGHLQGDRVLKTLGQVIRTSIRDSDHGCRYGGEEFSIIMPGISGVQAVQSAERLRKAFEGRVFEPEKGEKTRVTISIGVAEFQTGLSSEAFIDRADKALYQAKTQGKNQVCIFETPQVSSQ